MTVLTTIRLQRMRRAGRALGRTTEDVCAEAGEHPLSGPEAWWPAVLGSGYRATFEQLQPVHQEHVRKANLEYVLASGIKR